MVGGGQESIGDNFLLLLISQKEDPARTVDLRLTGVAEKVLNSKPLKNAERYIKVDSTFISASSFWPNRSRRVEEDFRKDN